jgi:diguanylate cyclase (GGDEF)-like protein
MADHSDRVAQAAASMRAPAPRWQRRLSEFAIVACCLIAASILTVLFTWIGAIRLLSHLLARSPDPTGTITALCLVALALSPFAMWFFYRQFASTQRALTQLAGIDTLTGLPNRLGLTERLEAAIEATRDTPHGVAILFVDLDRFKVVNDTFGHELGDALMVQVAHRLRDTVRPGDQVSRYGGDEFVVICAEIANAGMAKQIAQRIIDAVTVSYATGTQTLNISCSIGISLTNATGASARDSLRDADVALYQAKGAGPGVYRIYDHILGKALTPSAIESRLRTAVEREEFRVYYQPVVDTLDGRILGVEALLRWEDPERGLVEPREFLPLLEETGLIIDVGTWVLAEACRQAAVWRRTFPRNPLEIKVNVSARQLGQVGFSDLVSETLHLHALAPESLVLEITESALMDDVSSAWAMLRATKATGVRLALDDFGTGFSSLSYIRQFSLDMLKIDRSFVSGIAEEPDDLAIVEHVVGLARALGLVTVAEGVEQSEQLRLLQTLRCDRAQGFWFSPPVPPGAIDAMLSDPTLPERWSHVADETLSPTDETFRPKAPLVPNPLDLPAGLLTPHHTLHRTEPQVRTPVDDLRAPPPPPSPARRPAPAPIEAPTPAEVSFDPPERPLVSAGASRAPESRPDHPIDVSGGVAPPAAPRRPDAPGAPPRWAARADRVLVQIPPSPAPHPVLHDAPALASPLDAAARPPVRTLAPPPAPRRFSSDGPVAIPPSLPLLAEYAPPVPGDRDG